MVKLTSLRTTGEGPEASALSKSPTRQIVALEHASCTARLQFWPPSLVKHFPARPYELYFFDVVSVSEGQ